MPQHLEGEAATSWVLAQKTAPMADELVPTRQFDQEQTSPQSAQTSPHGGQTSAAYVPPSYYAPPPPHPAPYQPAQQSGQGEQSPVALGEWLSRGWKLYKENWFTMSLSTLLTGILSIVTIGILAGPLLMGLFRMAFKTMRGERPQVNDLFQWEGRFAQAFLAFFIFALISFGIPGVDRAGALSSFFSFIATPFLTVLLGLTMPSILERRVDAAKAINDIGRMIFSKDAFMWWIVGLVFASITVGGMIGCFVGIFVTTPWMVCAGATAYRDLYGIDDPNRTNA